MRGDKKVWLGLLTAVLFAACGGGGGGGSSDEVLSNEALLLAERVSVVDADESAALSISPTPMVAGFVRAALMFKGVGALPADSEYYTTPQNVFVEERSAESFDRINEILCMMAQTAYDEMINQGPYTAQVNASTCKSSNADAASAGESSQNQSSSSSRTEFEYWTVDSYRYEGQPHIVKAWIHQAASDDGFEPAMTIHAKVEITEAADTENPLGIFQTNFEAYPDDMDIFGGGKFMSGYLRAQRDADGRVVLQFYDGGGGGEMSFSEQVTLYKNADGTSGSGSIAIIETMPEGGGPTADVMMEASAEKSFNLAYDDAYFYRARNDGSDSVCLNRDDYNLSAWRYGLFYDEGSATPGSRLNVESGFPVRFDAADGQKYHGWADYYGIWFPMEAGLASGSTIYREIFEPGMEDVLGTPYTVFDARGKLKKNTREDVMLGDLTGVPLSWNRCDESGCNDYRVKWNGTSLVMDATRNQETNWTWQNLPEENVVFDENMWDFNFWSESLGGSGRINIFDQFGNRITPSNTTNVVFHREEVVYPGETVPATLACFEECPDPSAINEANPYFAASSFETPRGETFAGINGGEGEEGGVAPADLAPGVNYVEYTFDTTAMELLQDGSAVVQTDNTNRPWGVWTGAMIELTDANLADIACDWDTARTCVWQIWDKVDVFYKWETGADDWNRLTALRDADNAPVAFDPPMMLEYTHTNGAKYYLQYNGFDLQGIPGKCVDMDTGLDTECFNQDGSKAIRWVPEFMIATGSVLTDVVTNAVFYAKPLDVEMRMKATDVASCTGAGLSLQTYDLPGVADFVAPDLGDEPVIDSAPAVIAGEVQ